MVAYTTLSCHTHKFKVYELDVIQRRRCEWLLTSLNDRRCRVQMDTILMEEHPLFCTNTGFLAMPLKSLSRPKHRIQRILFFFSKFKSTVCKPVLPIDVVVNVRAWAIVWATVSPPYHKQPTHMHIIQNKAITISLWRKLIIWLKVLGLFAVCICAGVAEAGHPPSFTVPVACH